MPSTARQINSIPRDQNEPNSMRSEPVRRAAVERAVKAAASALLTRQISVRDALAVVTTAMGAPGEEATPRELAAAARKRHRASVVAEIVRGEQEGKSSIVSSLARRDALDVHDMVERATLENKYRRWRRAEEKRACARLPRALRRRKES